VTAAGTLRTALSIAGSDPTGGAGLQADLQVFRALGVHGAGVVTALTVQDSRRVHRVLPAFPSVVLDQLRVLLRDIAPRAVKVGMLASDDVLRSVLLGLDELDAAVPVVVDPVLRASDGTVLLERRAWPSLRGLFARAALVTPNLPEAEALSGRDVSTREGVEAAARSLVLEQGAAAALVKGGHRADDPDDLLALRQGDDLRLQWLPSERIPGDPVHGTGCALASAIAAYLALGEELPKAVESGRAFVAAGIRRAVPAGAGARFLVYP
jgi:hydroxymethylpyrimidine kinase/phosphomethylpyrimidine kinase